MLPVPGDDPLPEPLGAVEPDVPEPDVDDVVAVSPPEVVPPLPEEPEPVDEPDDGWFAVPLPVPLPEPL
ncbi:MAG: hypothetical protein JWM73_525, partial [Solirubrobacterales bacterium]|nr:hypothetical protein [Solirubrobacterales bacterium]